MQILLSKLIMKFGVSHAVARDSFFGGALSAGYIALGFWTTILLARFLGTGGYGTYAYVLSWMNVLTIPSLAGIFLVARETAQGLAGNQPDLVRGVWRWAERFVGAVSLAAIIFIVPIVVFWQGGLNNLQGLTMAWLIALIPLMSLNNIRAGAMSGMKYILSGQLPESVIRPGLFVIFIIAMHEVKGVKFSASLAMGLYTAAAFLSLVAGNWMFNFYTPVAVRRASPNVKHKIWLNSIIHFVLFNSIFIINEQINTIILGFFVNSNQIGVFKVAMLLSSLSIVGLGVMNKVVGPRYAELYKTGQMNQLQNMVTGSTRLILTINLILILLFVLIGRPFLIFVFGQGFSAAYLPMLILLAGQVINSLTGTVSAVLNMTGHEKKTTQGMLVALAINVSLSLGLIPILGISGAAVAMTASTAAWNIILWQMARKHLGINSLPFSIQLS